MSSLCLAAGALTAVLQLQTFTLAWTHSIEKVRWEEDWEIRNGKLELIAARIRGTGAGMEPPDGAKLVDGVWHYKPQLAPMATLTLAHSPYAKPYELCVERKCRPLAEALPGIDGTVPIRLSPCEPLSGRPTDTPDLFHGIFAAILV